MVQHCQRGNNGSNYALLLGYSTRKIVKTKRIYTQNKSSVKVTLININGSRTLKNSEYRYHKKCQINKPRWLNSAQSDIENDSISSTVGGFVVNNASFSADSIFSTIRCSDL